MGSYGVELFLLSVDEGISGYRDDSLETVKRNEKQVTALVCRSTCIDPPGAFYSMEWDASEFASDGPVLQYGIPLKIVSYKELYGWTMDEIVAKIGKKNNCTFCGVFRRQVRCTAGPGFLQSQTTPPPEATWLCSPLVQTGTAAGALQALDRGAVMLGANKLVTGHNADDLAETVLLNIVRGDFGRCAASRLQAAVIWSCELRLRIPRPPPELSVCFPSPMFSSLS